MQRKSKDNKKSMIKNNHSCKEMNMEFKRQKEMIVKSLRRGDKARIAKSAGVSTVTLWKSLTKNSISEMTEAEVLAYKVCLAYVNRKQNYNSKIEDRTQEIASKL